ncbi:malonic semialdehyde reductase [Zhihengliuella alba]|uniref:Malonic semialdehyde reductase n=1 Tax=Zhihengliuella alba TaxID=547018 RepID=A0ABP7E083_9MICC
MTVETLQTRPLAIDDEAADLLFREARSIRTFSEEPVSDEQLAHVYELLKFGPTLMNNQPLRITWVEQGASRDRLVEAMAEGNRPKTQTAPATAILSFDTAWTQHFADVFPHAPQAVEMFSEEGTRLEVGKNNAWLQAGYFIMAVRAVGLHAGPMAGFDADAVDAAFNEGTGHRSFMVVNVGHPGEDAAHERLPRLAPDVAVRTV